MPVNHARTSDKNSLLFLSRLRDLLRFFDFFYMIQLFRKRQTNQYLGLTKLSKLSKLSSNILDALKERSKLFSEYKSR